MKRLTTFVLMLLLVAASAVADDAAEPGRKQSVRTFQFRHKQAEAAAAAIKTLMSAEGTMSIQPSANSLVVTDAPENLKRIAAALAAFDVPPQPFRLSVRLVAASRLPGGRVAEGLEDLAPKLALLRYNALDSVGAAEIVGKEGEPGIIDMETYRADFKFGEYDQASDSIKVNDFKLARLEGETLTPLLKTTLNLKLGQTVILGATRQPNSDRALMIVVSAKR